MLILFLLAVLLAIPTSGLSIIAWVVWFVIAARNKAKERVAGLDGIRATRSVMEPLVGGSWADFYRALDIPKVAHKPGNAAYDERCGQHILNFISHNHHVTEAFMNALKLHRMKGNPALPTAIEALGYEREWQGGPMHHICYLAVTTLTSQNSLHCFDDVDMIAVRREMLKIADRFPRAVTYAS